MNEIEIVSQQSLAEIVNGAPEAAAVFERFGLDYCCGGERLLDEACATRGIEPSTVREALAATARRPEPGWASLPPARLVDHIEATHHRYLWAELPRLTALGEKVESVHRERHRELEGVRATLQELRADLEPHLLKEERVLFPMIRELAAATSPPEFHCGTLRNPISCMMLEHERAADLLVCLRTLTTGYEVPDDGCASYRALYTGLAELEADTHLHVHKENNLLFPAVLALESEMSGARDENGRLSGRDHADHARVAPTRAPEG